MGAGPDASPLILEAHQLPSGVWVPSTAGYASPNIVSSWVPSRSGAQLTLGYDVIEWMEACLVHTEGEWHGRPFRLLPWEKRLLLELFTLEPDPEWVAVPGQPPLFRRGLRRRYRQAAIFVPKKNGKTELAAALALYLLVGDGEPSPKGVFAAGSLKQARLSFAGAQTMLLRSPVLRMLVGERDVGDLVITIPSIPGSRMERVAAEAGTNDGPSLHFGVLDEIHEWEGESGIALHGVITNAGAARRNPLYVSISTPGVDPEEDVEDYELRSTAWARLWGRGWAAVDQPERDPSFYFLCAQAPAGSSWQDRTTWERANPSAGATVSWAYYQEQWAKGEGWCRRYFLGQPPGVVDEPWMPPEVWQGCAGDPVFNKADPVYAAVRVGHDNRGAAVAVAQRSGQQVLVRARFFGAELGPDEYLDLEAVEAHVLKLRERYPAAVLAAVQRRAGVRGQLRVHPAPGPEVSYHGAFFEASAQRLGKQGIVLVDLPHTAERMAQAAEVLLQLATQGALVHDGAHDLARHVGAVSAKQDTRGWRLQLPTGGSRRAELAVATMFAVQRAVVAPRAPSRALRRPRASR